MKFDRSDRFNSDWKDLPPEHRDAFANCAAGPFNTACDEWAVDPSKPWPDNLRVHPMKGKLDEMTVWEMTWSFKGPAGRATFHWRPDDAGDLVVVWRRVGGHDIYTNP